VLLLAAVFFGHGLQCGPAGGAAHAGSGGDTAVVAAAGGAHLALADHGLGVPDPAVFSDASSDSAPAAAVGSAPGHWHGLPGHLLAVCLAVLAAGLAGLLVLAAFPALRQTAQTGLPAWLRGLSWPVPLRPPDLFTLCVLRT
jgi:hypothetical protein